MSRKLSEKFWQMVSIFFTSRRVQRSAILEGVWYIPLPLLHHPHPHTPALSSWFAQEVVPRQSISVFLHISCLDVIGQPTLHVICTYACAHVVELESPHFTPVVIPSVPLMQQIDLQKSTPDGEKLSSLNELFEIQQKQQKKVRKGISMYRMFCLHLL